MEDFHSKGSSSSIMVAAKQALERKHGGSKASGRMNEQQAFLSFLFPLEELSAAAVRKGKGLGSKWQR